MPTDSKTAGHTATPWETHRLTFTPMKDTDVDWIEGETKRADGSARYVVWAEIPKMPDSRKRANLIVTAVNSHASNLRKVEALRDALRKLTIDANRLCDRQLGGTYEEDCRRSIDAAERALALAEEQA